MFFKSQNIIDNQEYFIEDCNRVFDYFKSVFPNGDSTWSYSMYNIFCATSPSPIFYNLFKELNGYIREYVGHDDPLWMQAWLNYHMPDQVLDWHGHDWPHHGYICIDPKDTKTVFEDFEVENEIGLIYIGPGYKEHKVEVIKSYDTPRITLGFDIHTEETLPYKQFSLMPIL